MPTRHDLGRRAHKPSPEISVVDNEAATTSMAVAEFFGKQHKDVIRAIRNLCHGDPEAARRNFAPGSRKDANNQDRPFFSMDQTGFVMLAMGFTGQAAVQWRRRYIQAFDAMAAELAGQENRLCGLREDRIQLIERIIEEHRAPVREALYADLEDKCAQIGIAAPSLPSLQPTTQALAHQEQSKYHHLGVKLWQSVRELVEQEIPVNHSHPGGLCALHMPTIRELARMNGYDLGRKSDLRRGLQALDALRLVGTSCTVNSFITGKATRVWLFETAEFDDTAARQKIRRARIETLAGIRQKPV